MEELKKISEQNTLREDEIKSALSRHVLFAIFG